MEFRIQEYDQVDPLSVLNLNLLSLNYALTPERVRLIRQLDPRPFPFFMLYAVDEGLVVGQVGVYRLPMMTIEGPEDLGGVCPVCTHPAFSGHGIASLLLDEAHHRMVDVGLRFSTLGTARHRGAYKLYRQCGYEDFHIPLATFASRESLLMNGKLKAELAGPARLRLTDELFERIAQGHIGFTIRFEHFLTTLAAIGEINPDEVWLIWDDDELIGYAIARILESVLVIDHLSLIDGYNAEEAVSAITEDLAITYLQIRIDNPIVEDSLIQAGYPVGRPTWSTFMIKPLTPDISMEAAHRLFGIGTKRFLISFMDVT